MLVLFHKCVVCAGSSSDPAVTIADPSIAGISNEALVILTALHSSWQWCIHCYWPEHGVQHSSAAAETYWLHGSTRRWRQLYAAVQISPRKLG